MSCNCSLAGLGETTLTARRLTDSEIGRFLYRNPGVFAKIQETKAVQAAGLYDFDFNPYEQWIIPGVIPPWGMQVLGDEEFGNVTIMPLRDFTWRYTGFSPELGDINKPPYVSNIPHEQGLLDDIANALKSFGTTAVVLLVGYFVVTYRSNKGKK